VGPGVASGVFSVGAVVGTGSGVAAGSGSGLMTLAKGTEPIPPQ